MGLQRVIHNWATEYMAKLAISLITLTVKTLNTHLNSRDRQTGSEKRKTQQCCLQQKSILNIKTQVG